MSCYAYNCENQLGDHTLLDCEDEVLGGFPNLIFLACGHELTDASNGTDIQAEIDAGRATVVQNIKISSPVASATKVTSNIANRPDKVTRYTYEMPFMDGNVNAENTTFYNSLFAGGSFGGVIIHQPDEGIVLFYNNDFRAEGSLVAPDNDGEFLRFEGTIVMEVPREAVNPEIATEPAGIFN